MARTSLAVLSLALSLALASHGAVEGRVTDQGGQPLTGAQVWLDGYPAGTATDTAGRYMVEVPRPGEFIVIYQFIGYKSETLAVTVDHGARVRRDVRLKQTSIQIPPVETRARRELIHETKSAEPTVVIPQEAAGQTGRRTIGEAAELEPGIRLLKRCSACEEAEVSIQGLPGRFSLVLLEGLPVFSDLASRYILDILPVDFIDRLEVIKGASGAIWGSDAIAGAINVRLLQPVRPFEARGAFTWRWLGNDLSAMVGSGTSRFGVSLIGAGSNRTLLDLNNDGWSENTAFRRGLLLTSLNYYPSSKWQIGTGGSYTDEDRRTGPIAGDSLLDKVHIRRWDIWQQTRFTPGPTELRFRVASSWHTENGVLEQGMYSAHQRTFFGEMNASLSKLFGGLSLLYHDLRDVRLFGAGLNENGIGVWMGGQNVTLASLPVGNEFLPALRLDINSSYGTILSPYLAVKLYPGWVDLSLAGGTGFRTPSIILTSLENLPNGYQYAIRRDSNLTRESGVSLQFGAARTLLLGATVADLRLNLFHHHVTNFITADFVGLDTASRRAVFYYYNLAGAALSSGGELSMNLVFPNGLTAAVGAYLLAPRNADGQVLPFSRRWTARYSLGYRHSSTGIELGLNGDINGSMLIQTVMKDGTVRRHDSPVYMITNLRASRQFGFFRLNVGINNIWDYYQPPRHHNDGLTEYYWAPTIGRELYAGLTITM